MSVDEVQDKFHLNFQSNLTYIFHCYCNT